MISAKTANEMLFTARAAKDEYKIIEEKIVETSMQGINFLEWYGASQECIERLEDNGYTVHRLKMAQTGIRFTIIFW